MTTTRSKPVNVLVLDMSTLKFRWNAARTSCAVLTQRSEIVAVVSVGEGEDSREVAFRALDAALDRGQILRPDPADPAQRISYRVALYNPFTGEISTGRVPETVTFGDDKPVELSREGVPAVAVVSGRNPELTIGDRRLASRTLTFAGLTRAQLAHAS